MQCGHRRSWRPSRLPLISISRLMRAGASQSAVNADRHADWFPGERDKKVGEPNRKGIGIAAGRIEANSRTGPADPGSMVFFVLAGTEQWIFIRKEDEKDK